MPKMPANIAAACAIGVGVLASGAASAQHWHGGARVGVYLGVPLYAPIYYPAPYYYSYPLAAYAPAAPTVYVERGDAPPAPSAPQTSWHYCPDSKAYYPNVRECASPWQQVSPRPTSTANREGRS